jgi:hypothetical protein
MGSFSPGPILLHLCPGHGLDTPEYLLVIKLNGRDPARVEVATHITHLVWPALERRNAATDICRQEIVTSEAILP